MKASALIIFFNADLEKGDWVDVGDGLTQGLGHMLQTLLGRKALLEVKEEECLK
jgi:hypothetical protein